MFNATLFIDAINQLAKEKRISKSIIKEAIEESLVKTYKKEIDPEANLKVLFNISKGELKLFRVWNVVSKIEDQFNDILLEKALQKNSKVKVGKEYLEEIPFTKEFGILTTLQVKQIIKQKIREKQKEIVLQDYKEKIGTLIKGKIENVKDNFYIVAFNKDYGFLSKNEVPKNRYYRVGDQIEAIITSIEESPKGIPIILSQNSPQFVEAIVNNLIPEVENGEIQIKAIARFPGIRTKMIVATSIPGLDPVGTIIGERGSRIKEVIEKVGREYIDVIPEISDIQKQVERAMVPADVKYVHIGEGKIIVVVDENNFSSAIGRNGSNAKVVAKLLNLEIDIKKVEDVDFEIPKKSAAPMKEHDFNYVNKEYEEFNSYDEFQDDDDLYDQLEDNLDDIQGKKKHKKKKKSEKAKISQKRKEDKHKNEIKNYTNYDYDEIEDDSDINYDEYDDFYEE